MDTLKTRINQIKESPTFRIFLTVLILWVVGSFSIIYLENGDLADVGNAIWWTIVTITTVGYGDIAPLTPLGQAVSAIIMLIGYSIIAVPTGIITTELVFSKSNSTALSFSICLIRSGSSLMIFGSSIILLPP